MTLSSEEARAMLADVESVIARVKQSHIYRTSGAMLMLWGAIVALGNVLAAVAPRWAGWGWIGVDWARRRRDSLGAAQDPSARRTPAASVAGRLCAVFSVWRDLERGDRHISARANSMRSGRPLFHVRLRASPGCGSASSSRPSGSALAGLVLAGFFWAGERFRLYLALVNGGGLILCGLWMRRA